VPTYNAPSLLLETLETVFAQTFGDYEVVVVNDGSTDDTAERLHPLVQSGKIRLINQPNGGIGNARNRGIDEAQGKYVALLDHDDLWMPAKLAAQVAFMESHPECSACSVPWASSLTPSRATCDYAAVTDATGCVTRPMLRLSEGRVFLISSSILFDRERARGLRYMPYPRCIEDTPFQIKLMARGRFGIASDQILMIYRVHGANYSSQADFFYNGVKMLRAMDKAGSFSEFHGQDRMDMLAFFAHLARSATAAQLSAGLRTRAAELYLRDFRHQLAFMRWKYLAMTPCLLLAPRTTLKRWRLGRTKSVET
jgi:glycosyltransferase involved in cell wall biosynthesis